MKKYILAGVLLLVLIIGGAPLLASAARIDEVRAQIASFESSLAALKAELATLEQNESAAVDNAIGYLQKNNRGLADNLSDARDTVAQDRELQAEVLDYLFGKAKSSGPSRNAGLAKNLLSEWAYPEAVLSGSLGVEMERYLKGKNKGMAQNLTDSRVGAVYSLDADFQFSLLAYLWPINKGLAKNIYLDLKSGAAPAIPTVVPRPTPAPLPSLSPTVGVPDVVITDLSFDRAPKVGESILITATVKNQGTGDVPVGRWLGLGYFMNGVSGNRQADGVWAGTSLGLKAGQTMILVTSPARAWRPTIAGEVRIAGVIDDQKLTTESNEYNNEFLKTVNVVGNATSEAVVPIRSEVINTSEPTPVVSAGQPDLVINDLYPSPQYPQVGDSVKLIATVVNKGTADVPPGTWIGLGYRINGVVNGGQSTGVWAGTSAGLKVGQYATLITDEARLWKPTQAGTFTITGVIDDQRLTVESNEDNNTLEKAAVVTAKSAAAAPSSQSAAAFSGLKNLFNW